MIAFSEGHDLAITLQNLELVEAPDSHLQEIRLYRHPKLGLVLTINGELQHVEAWQSLYHEPVVHVPASFVVEIGTVLILGGGSLYAAAEALKYATVRRCVLVDHDRAVLELMARHCDHARQVLADPRFYYRCSDAWRYLSACSERYDLIVNDCLDLLVSDPSFRLLADRLSCEGVCSDVIYRHLLEGDHVRRTRRALRQFPQHAISMVVVPEYPGALHALTMWGTAPIAQDAKLPRNRVQAEWLEREQAPCEFYDPRFLAFHLHVSPWMARLWNAEDSLSR